MRFRHLPSGEVAAEAWCASLEEAIPAWIAERGAVRLSNSSDGMPPTQLRLGFGGTVFVRLGDWITLNRIGLLDVWTPEEFAAKFAPVEAE